MGGTGAASHLKVRGQYTKPGIKGRLGLEQEANEGCSSTVFGFSSQIVTKASDWRLYFFLHACGREKIEPPI